jgi:hypothetical protein
MVDAAMRRELAAMVRDHAEDALESEEERQFLVLTDDCEELLATLHAATRDQHLLMTARL